MPSLSTVEKLVPARIRTRGDRYFEEERVEQLRREADGCVAASVRGSESYEVRLLITPEGELGFDCECVYFEQNLDVCKHVWAALRAADRALLLRLDEIFFLNAMFDEDELPPPESNLVPFPRRLAARSDWHNRLERLPAAVPAAAPEGEILYALDASPPSGIQIRSLIRKPRKNGGFLKPRTFAPSHAEIARLAPLDREILGLMYIHHYAPEWDQAAGSALLRGSGKRFLLPKAAATGRLYLHKDGQLIGPITWDEGPPWTLRLRLQTDAGRSVYRLEGDVMREGESIAIADAEAALPGFLLHGTRLSPVEPEEATAWIESLSRAPIEAPEKEREDFIAALLGRAPVELELPGDLQRKTERPLPVARLLLVRGSDREGEGWTGRFLVRYGDLDVSPGEGPRSVIAGDRVILRDLAGEADFLARLESLRVVRDYFGDWRIRASQEAEVLPALAAEGWEIELHGQPLRLADEVTLEIESGIDWFDLKAEVRFGNLTVPVAELLQTPTGVMRKLADGSFGLIRSDLLEGLDFLEGIDAKRDGRFRFSNRQALLIDLLTRSRRGVDADAGSRRCASACCDVRAVEPRSEAGRVRRELRPYQREGLGWLHFLRGFGFGGCLADDMGLGKTVQVLALLEARRGATRSEAPRRPSLVVVPRSLLFNWRRRRRASRRSCACSSITGPSGSEPAADFDDYDLVLTTYGTLRARRRASERRSSSTTSILDEAQAIKNATSRDGEGGAAAEARHRLALERHADREPPRRALEPLRVPQPRHARRGALRSGGTSAAARCRTRAARDARRARCGRSSCAARRSRWRPTSRASVEQTLWCELERRAAGALRRASRLLSASLLEKVEDATGWQGARCTCSRRCCGCGRRPAIPALIDRRRPRTSAEARGAAARSSRT